MKKEPEYLALANIPRDPSRAKLMKERMERGEVEPHPSYREEVLATLENAIEGKLLAEEESRVGAVSAMFLKCNSFSNDVKTVSATEIESLLVEYLQRKCGCNVEINLTKLFQEHKGTNYSPNIEFAIEFKVVPKFR
jgi:hypothetical protein